MDTEVARLHVLISGSVQGVGFRQFVLKRAQQHAVFGWVRNRLDRRVELVAEGSRLDLLSLLDLVSEGSPASFVRNVDVVWEKPTGEFHTFEITG